MLAHNVYFKLKDASEDAQNKLIASCKKYLSHHDGTAFFSVGPRAESYQRPVNDQEFHIGLTVVFESREAHDAYQVAEAHLQFIEENKDNWDHVRVFDNDASA